MYSNYIKISFVTVPLLAVVLWFVYKKYFSKKPKTNPCPEVLTRKIYNVFLSFLFINVMVILYLNYAYSYPTIMHHFLSVYFLMHMVVLTYVKILYQNKK